MSLKDERKVARKSLDLQKEKLLSKWLECWKIDGTNDNLDVFLSLFTAIHKDIEKLKEYNKQQNIKWKKRFLYIVLISYGVYMGFFVYYLCKGNDKFSVLVGNSLIFILIIFLSSIISKWIDIKKYQETWVRHSLHLHILDTEMMRFICQMEPYNTSDRRIIFIERVLNIWDKNEDKFVHNMEEKELGLMDIFSSLNK